MKKTNLMHIITLYHRHSNIAIYDFCKGVFQNRKKVEWFLVNRMTTFITDQLNISDG